VQKRWSSGDDDGAVGDDDDDDDESNDEDETPAFRKFSFSPLFSLLF
jgi:hypothetical protein